MTAVPGVETPGYIQCAARAAELCTRFILDSELLILKKVLLLQTFCEACRRRRRKSRVMQGSYCCGNCLSGAPSVLLAPMVLLVYERMLPPAPVSNPVSLCVTVTLLICTVAVLPPLPLALIPLTLLVVTQLSM